MTQNAVILQELQADRELTPRDAAALGIMRLSARIWELRRAGHRIYRELATVRTRYGSARVARYSLRK